MQFDIVANDKATAAMGKVERSADGFGKKLSGSLTMAAAKAAAILATIQKLGQVIGEQVDVADEAAKLGVSIETYQRLKFAAEQYNASVEDVAKGLVKVNNVLDEAATKGGPNAEVLRALGFAQDDITNRAIRTEEVYKRLAEAIAEAGSEEEKFALASRVFGDRMAQTMVPILADFATFNAMQGKVLTMTDENAKALDNFSERLALASTDAKNLFGGMVGSAIRGLGLDKPIAAPVPEADKEAQRARGKAARDALLKAGAPKAALDKEAGFAVSSLQQIGGGIAKGPGSLESYAARTAIATETIAGNTMGGVKAPPTGGSDITKIPPTQGGRTIIDSPNIIKGGLGIAPKTPRPAR
jgi:hypothetical protein